MDPFVEAEASRAKKHKSGTPLPNCARRDHSDPLSGKYMGAVHASEITQRLLRLYKERAIGYNCGVLLLETKRSWARVPHPASAYRVCQMFPAHAFRVQETAEEDGYLLSSCTHCKNVDRATREYIFEDFGGPLPSEVAALRNHHEKCLLSLANMYSRTFWPSSYSYVHVFGPMTLQERIGQDFSGLIGMLQVGLDVFGCLSFVFRCVFVFLCFLNPGTTHTSLHSLAQVRRKAMMRLWTEPSWQRPLPGYKEIILCIGRSLHR